MTTDSQNPTVILVHGAFADASSWARVLERLRDAGIAAEAIPNPLRGLTFDGDYVASVLGQIDGPIVLVGHSYGGAVMTYASSKAPNVRALVYGGVFRPRPGRQRQQVVADYPPPELASSVEVRTFPNGDERGLEALISCRPPHTVDGDRVAGLPEALLAELDEVAARWHALSVGEALTLTWPAQLTIRPGGSSRGCRPNRDRGIAAHRR
jgi:pimeloyl-ACP methyl ester carboxylesterase